MQSAAERYNKQVEGIEPDAQQALMGYNWPGNVRQLKNVIENMVVLSPGSMLSIKSLPKEIVPVGADLSSGGVDNLVGLTMEQVEKEHIRETLKRVQGNREQAAKILGIGERTLYRKIKEYDLH
jgi:two-component system response regulator HydG